MRVHPKLIDIPVHRDARGALAVVEGVFPVQRVYFLFDVQAGAARGGHAHKTLTQLFLVPSGSYSVAIRDGLNEAETFTMSDPSKGLLLPPGYWREIFGFSSGGVCLVLASHIYCEEDYLRDFEQYVKWKHSL